MEVGGVAPLLSYGHVVRLVLLNFGLVVTHRRFTPRLGLVDLIVTIVVVIGCIFQDKGERLEFRLLRRMKFIIRLEDVQFLAGQRRACLGIVSVFSYLIKI